MYSHQLAAVLLSLALRTQAHPKVPRSDSGWGSLDLKTIVTFGDSYTDESRLLYFENHNGSAPPAGWVQPINNDTYTGGYVWSRYVSWYSEADLYNYAVSGAVCSNDITPRWDDDVVGLFLDMLGYEIHAFLADKAYKNADGSKFFTGEAESTVYSLWIGTNDLGNKAFLTDGENIVQLNLAPQYGLPQDGGVVSDKYFPNKAMWNATALNERMRDEADLVNDVFEYRTAVEFTDMYYNPSAYFNGTAPPNATSWINQCTPAGTDCHLEPSPDSYLWYDELHKSGQADRHVAMEHLKVINGTSKFAQYW